MRKALVVCLFIPGVSLARERAPRKAAREKVVADFSRVGAWEAVVAGEGVTVMPRGSTVELPARKASKVTVWSSPAADWSEFDELRLGVISSDEGRVPVRWELSDGSGGASASFVLDAGANEIRVPLRDLYREDAGGALDARDVRELALSFGRMREPFGFQLGKMALVRYRAGEERMRVYDLGPKGSVWPGSVPVPAGTQYDDARGYGLAAGELREKVLRGEFSLLGDGVQGSEIGFSVKLPPGEYEVRAVAFHISWNGVRDNANYSIEAEGEEVVKTDLTLEKFLTFEHHYYGADVFFDPRVGLFEQYFAKYFEPHAFAVKVEDGKLDLTFKNCTVMAICVWPKGSDGQDAFDALYDEVAFEVWKKHLRYRPHEQESEPAAPSKADSARGYCVFSRGVEERVFPEEKPAEGEAVEGLNVTLAPGEYEGVSFVVNPLRELGVLRVAVARLAGPGGVIPESAVELSLVKEHLQRVSGPYHEAVPTLLVPWKGKGIEALPGWNRQYWLTVRAPDDAAAGVYSGSVIIAPERGRATVLPFSVTVRPFRLEKADASFGMWNNGAASAHQYGAHGGSPEIAAGLIEAGIADMAAHGLTGFQFRDAHPRRLKPDGTLEMDFSTLDLIAEAMRNHGMGEEVSIIGTIGSCNYRLMRWGLKEFGPEFNKAFKYLLGQIVEWSERNELNMVVMLLDEPREARVQDWNRNRVDSIRYLKLAKEVPGVKTTITLMGDRDYFGDDYTPMVPLMDVAMTHAWEGSRQIMLLTLKEKIAECIPYNNGWSRYVWGFYVWSSGSGGNWQWVYSWENSHSHLPLFFSTESSAAFAYPGGYVPTIKYEWVREGIDDYRYLRTLEAAIGSSPRAEAAKTARAFLERLRKFLPPYPKTGLRSGEEAGGMSPGKLSGHCPAWREQVAEFIAAIRESRPARLFPEATMMFPKALEEVEKEYVAPVVVEGPTLDGALDDDAWKKAPVATGFVSIPRAEPASVATEVRIVTDGEWLYLAFHNAEPLYGELKAYAMNRDDPCWQDDAVELFLDTNGDGKTYYQIIINTLGTVQDSDTRDGLWNGEVKAAARKGKGFWDLEVAVKLSSMKASAAPGDVWAVNFCRDRWAGKSENSSWAFVGTSFHTPGKFGKLRFEAE